MIRKKDLPLIGKKCSKALRASAKLSNIILEKYLAGILPETRRLSIEELNVITDFDYFELKNFMGNQYYRVNGNTFNIIADNRYLAEQSKSYCKHLILKLVVPSQADLILNELLSIASIKEFECQISTSDLICFNWLNLNSFYQIAKRVYNDILQKKLHAGDNIILYFDITDLTAFDIADILDQAEKFDYFFDKHGVLKCDLETNRDILIKNFINTVLYSFNDPNARIVLLQKLNSKYPVFIEHN